MFSVSWSIASMRICDLFCIYVFCNLVKLLHVFLSWQQRMHLALLHTAKALLFLLSRKMLSLERGIHTDPWSIAEAALLRPEGGRLWMTDLLSGLSYFVWCDFFPWQLADLFLNWWFWKSGGAQTSWFSYFFILRVQWAFFIYKHILIIKYIVQISLVKIWICFCSMTGGSPRAHISIYL